MTYATYVMCVTVRVGENEEDEPIVFTKVRSVNREGEYLRIFLNGGDVKVFFISDALSIAVDFYEVEFGH